MYAERAQASSGMRQIAMAWQQYAHENEGQLPSADNSASPAPPVGNSKPPWVLKPNGTTPQVREDAIEQGALYPFLTSLGVFTDPNHAFPTYINSYSINGYLNGHWRASANGVLHLDQANPGAVFLIPEYDARNYNINSFIMNPVSCNWIDRVAGNYWNGDNLCFVDGHVDFRRWEDADTLRDLATHNLSDPGSVDCDFFEQVFTGR